MLRNEDTNGFYNAATSLYFAKALKHDLEEALQMHDDDPERDTTANEPTHYISIFRKTVPYLELLEEVFEQTLELMVEDISNQ